MGDSKRYDIQAVSQPEFALKTLSKNEDGEKEEEWFEPPFSPYCWIDIPENVDVDKARYVSDLSDALEESYCRLVKDDRDDYWKVESKGNDWNIRDFTNAWEYKVYEADLRFERRVMIDEGLQVSVPDQHDILYFDIEVDPRGEFPDPDEAKKQILSIAAVDSDGNEYFFCHDSETEILRDFKDVLEDYYVVAGWNSGTFDWPYIKARMELQPFDIDYFSVVHFDLLYLMKHINREERESWALDDLGQDELGMEKTMSEEDHEEGYEVLWKWYQEDRETLEEYNIQDCAITAGLDDKYRLIQLIFRICRRGYCRPSQIMYRDNSGELNIAVGKAADSVVMYTSPDHVFNDKSMYRDIDGFPGGEVFEPVEGVHFDVMTADFSGMYPAMIRDFNIGPNTWIDADNIEDAVVLANEQWPDHDITANDIIIGIGEHPDANTKMARGYFIDPDIEKSVLARAVDELESLRMEFKTKKKEATQGTEEWHKYNNIDRGLKVLMNTIYGIAASTLHRYYIPGMSENITEMGQFLIRKCKEHGDDELPFVEETIYGDTDSVMYRLNTEHAEMDGFDEYVSNFREQILDNPDAEDSLGMDMDDLYEAWQVIDVAKKTANELNEFIVSWVKDEHNSHGEHMKMDLDYVWRNYIVTEKKKKYAGEIVYGEGPASYRDVTGFKAVKANTSAVIADFQRDLIDALLHDDPTSGIISEYHDRLFNGEFDEQLVKHTRLGKMPDEYATLMSHARAAKMIIEREGDKGAVRTGDKIPHIKYGSDKTKVQPTDNGIDDLRPSENFCPECGIVVNTKEDHSHEVLDGPHFRPRHYSYLWDNRFEPTMELLKVSRHEQTSLGAFA